MSFDFDVIVIGSGFGGSVSACRLVEKGYKVCLLERGQQWNMHEFPRRIYEIKNKLFWDPKGRRFGFMEFCDYPESDLMSVSASGLGGGSLIYANVLMRMPPEFFRNWPGNINRERLNPFYDKVIDMMEASPYPFESDPYYKNTPKTKFFKEVSGQLHSADEATAPPEFIYPDLAIRFRGDFPGHQSLNKHGALQSKCTKCGECDIGCNIHAKNTLDLNYIYRARNLKSKQGPAEIRTEAEVVKIVPLPESSGGYEVTYRNPKSPASTTTIKTKKVIVSAGSIGSTALLLKMKAQGHLSKLSPVLGKKWCGNGDLEGSVLDSKHEIDPTTGPVITSAIRYRFKDYPDGFRHGLFIQDAGFPIGLAWYISGKILQPSVFKYYFRLLFRYLKGFWNRTFGPKSAAGKINIGSELSKAIDQGEFIRRVFLLLGMGRDRNDGEITLRHDGEPLINWKIERSQLHYDRAREEMRKIADKLGGFFVDNPLTHIKKIIAVHPIGGCVMADSENEGVVKTTGEAFGHKDLYVIDASILPYAPGPNPSLTIAALAEYIIDQFPEKS